ncbi:MAG: hypothetical protein ABI852_06925 [Gemmatimonadaceae bacterium]
MSRFSRVFTSSIALLAFVACSDDKGGNPVVVPAVLTLSAGDAQTAAVGTAVAIPPAIKATRSGQPAAGVVVNFQVLSGGGTVTGASATTDATGVAKVGSWVMGSALGAQTLAAQSSDASGSLVTFNATAISGAPKTLTKQAGDDQSAPVSSVLPIRPSVKVVDQFGNVIAGATVTFAVASGGGTVTGGAQTTSATGIATVGNWTLGSTPGANSITATVTGAGVTGSPATFNATGTVGAPATVTKQAGDAQTASAGVAVAVRPAVKVVDQFGNPVSGTIVNFVVAGGGGTIAGGSATTGADGIATAGDWTLGGTLGAQTLTATAVGVTTGVTFTATSTAAPAKIVVVLAGATQTAIVKTAVATKPSVKVTDQFGNPIAGVTVTFAVASGGGTVTGATQTTAADGSATVGSWTIGQTSGANVLRATATGATITTGNPVDFSATGIAGAPATITKLAGDFQAQLAGSGLILAPSVSLADQFGNSIFNQTVTFGVTSGGGLLTGATPSTNTAGVATLGSWVLGATPGNNTITASAGGLNVVFTATGLALLDAPKYFGTYTGTWVNSTFGTTDVATVTIVDIPGSGAGITISAGGTIMGTPGGIPATQRTATYSATTAFFNGNIPQLGNFNLNVGSSATTDVLDITAAGTGVPNAAVRRWDAQGTITPTEINMTFIVSFVTGNPAVGSITLTKP